MSVFTSHKICGSSTITLNFKMLKHPCARYCNWHTANIGACESSYKGHSQRDPPIPQLVTFRTFHKAKIARNPKGSARKRQWNPHRFLLRAMPLQRSLRPSCLMHTLVEIMDLPRQHTLQMLLARKCFFSIS